VAECRPGTAGRAWHTRRSTCLAARRPQFDLATLGNLVVDVVVAVKQFPLIAGEHQDLRGGLSMSPGGACNALTVATRLGGRAVAADWLGEDELSTYIERKLEELQVDTGALARRPGPSLACVIIVSDKGEHTFVSSNERPTAVFEPNLDLESARDQLPAEFQTALTNAGAMLVDGYALDDLPFRTLAAAVSVARRNNCMFWFDPQSAGCHLKETNPALVKYLLESVDGLVVTESELVGFSGLTGPQQLLASFGNMQVCAVKLGARGCLIASRKTGAEEVFVPGFDLGGSFVDSVGAGDSFIAALIVGLSAGLSLVDAGTLANAAGAATCMRSGAGENVADLARVEQLLQDAGRTDILLKLSSRGFESRAGRGLRHGGPDEDGDSPKYASERKPTSRAE